MNEYLPPGSVAIKGFEVMPIIQDVPLHGNAQFAHLEAFPRGTELAR
jgi:hypothetical protein